MINKYQDENPDFDQTVMPMHFNSYSKEQIKIVEDFLCDNTKMEYIESYAYRYNSISKGFAYDENRSY